MGDFETMLADCASVFSDAFNNATVTYTPRNGVPVSVSAIIDWNPPVKADHVPQVKRPAVRIDVENHATRGISATDAGLIGGSIAFPEMYGSTRMKTAGIQQASIASVDGGRIVLEF